MCETKFCSMSGKRSDLSVGEKRDILKRYDVLPKCSQRKAASILGVSQPLLCKMLKNRNNIENQEELNLPTTRKRKRAGKCVQVEEMLLRWFVQARTSCLPVTNAILFDKALSIASQLGIQDFSPTDGWLTRWKSRNNIAFYKTTIEKRNLVTSCNKNWMDNFLQDILPRYDTNDVYNMAETGLYFRALPYLTIDSKSVNVSECHKYQMHRLTVLLVCNMTGSDKKRPLVIGKSQNPRCFQNVKMLPVDYLANSNAWMTSIIFTDFLKEWDKSLNQRKILLLLDNCSAHPKINLDNIILMFLPSDSSIILPLHLGIINTVKTSYRKLMGSYIAVDGDEDHISASQLSQKITVLEAVHMIAESWEKVSPTVIQNCFCKAGFSLQSFNNLDNNEFLESGDTYLQNWVNIDSNCPTFGPFSDTDSIKSYFTYGNTNPRENNKKKGSEDNNVPTIKEVRAAVETLKASIQQFGNEETFKLFYKLKANIENQLQHSYDQTKLLN